MYYESTLQAKVDRLVRRPTTGTGVLILVCLTRDAEGQDVRNQGRDHRPDAVD